MQERWAALAPPRAVAAGLVALLVGLGGCGGDGGRLDTAGYRRRAAGICRHAARASAGVDLPALDDPGAARAMRRIVAIERAAVGELRDLEPPRTLEPRIDEWLATIDQLVDEADFLRESLAHRDRSIAQVVGTRTARLALRAEALGEHLGVTGCTLPSPPPVDPPAA